MGTYGKTFKTQVDHGDITSPYGCQSRMSPIAAAKLLVLLMGEPRVADPQRLAD